MEENIIPEFLNDLPRRNKPSYPILRAILRYFLMFLLAFTAGMLISKATYVENADTNKMISSHFTQVFRGCNGCKDYFTVIISASSSDIRYLLLLFTTGFTYFCAPATSVFLMCKGATLGFSLNYMLISARIGALSLPLPYLAATIFTAIEFITSLFMVWLGAKSLVFSYEFRKLRGRKRRILTSPVIYNYLLLYLTAFGLVLIINTVSCLLSLMIYG